MDGLVEACGWIEEVSSGNGLSGEIANSIQVCFEELASNVVRHSGDGLWKDPTVDDAENKTALVLKVSLSIDDRKAELRLEDNGKPFDVAAAPAHGVDRPIADMAVGGLGLHLVKTLASAVDYQHTPFGNQVKLEFSRAP
jgi:anti-sigma regulatory factor (Ser/Thr protein kinase)